MQDFVHLHNHTHYSLLDAACSTDALIDAAVADEQKALALTDHGVMFGCYEFYKNAKKSGIKPILGFEAYIARNSRFEKMVDKTKSKKRNYFHLVLLAKDMQGYKNLMKLTTLGHTEGFYYKPRIDRELLEKYKDGIIACSACIGGVINAHLVSGDFEAARESAIYYKQLFGDDFYFEMQNHRLAEDNIILEHIPKLSAELGIKYIATNDIHYIKKEHAIAHNVLLLIKDLKSQNQNEVDINNLRYRSDEYYFKTREEMSKLFSAFPDALSNTVEIAEKCNVSFEKKLYMPQFPIPDTSKSETLEQYLEELTYEGLRNRYTDITDEIKQRADYELKVINDMGFAGYFLIVQDFVIVAKTKLGVRVGPGRGSAAGSIVAYALSITDVDPLPYDLLFERFLNPERVSMPDIDIDFCDNKREKVIEYVKEKYGAGSVAQIITFGKLSSKAVLKDVGRVLGINHSLINQITAKIPVEQGKVKPLIEALDLFDLKDFKESQDPKMQKLIEYSLLLEGLFRHSSIHAAGVVIAPSDVWNYVPLYKAAANKDKDTELATQYTMNDLEDAGLLKMDFLGLRTLSIIDYTLEMIEKNHNKEIDIDKVDFSDDYTYKEIFSKGNTLGVFQFESKGMQEYLCQLKPMDIEELTAMNALYRPGPMDNIPEYIDRKHGKKPISYLHEIMAPSLKKTYGIIVYQEQVMQLVQDVAGFSLGQADILRRAMGKKKDSLMNEQKPIFIDNAEKRGVLKNTATEIFELIAKFAKYGFNKSHALAYSLLAFQTGWLKAHYTAEFLAANMSAEMNDLNKIVELIEEAKRFGIEVLPPDVNRSMVRFNAEGKTIYFGLAAIKNVGSAAVEKIIEARQEKPFVSFFDFVARVDNKLINRRALEALICAGAFDSINNAKRSAMFEAIETAIEYSKACQNNDDSLTNNLFGDVAETIAIVEPSLPAVPDWSEKERLQKEKEFVNFYISGHPLDEYKPYVEYLCTLRLGDTSSSLIGSKVQVCGIVNSIRTRLDKRNNTIAFVELEDFTGKAECIFWSDAYQNFASYLTENSVIMCLGKSETDSENTSLKVVVDEVYSIEKAAEKFAKSWCITIDIDTADNNIIQKFYALCDEESAKCTIMFRIISSNNHYKMRYLASNVNISFSKNKIEQVVKLFGRNNVSIGNS